MIELGDHVVHDYNRIDHDRVWGVVRDDIPALLPQLRELLEGVGRDVGTKLTTGR